MPIIITPVTSLSPTQPGSAQRVIVPVSQEPSIAAIEDPIIDLLKQLLPVDTPIGTALEKFQQSIARMNPEGSLDQTVADVISLLKSLPVDLKTVSSEQLRAVIDRLGLRYEPMLEAAFAQRLPLSAPQVTAQNLKAALLKLLETLSPSPGLKNSSQEANHVAEGSIRQPGIPITKSEQTHGRAVLNDPSQQNVETVIAPKLQAQLQRLGAEKATLPTPFAIAVGEKGDRQQPAELVLGADQLKHILDRLNPEGERDLDVALLKLLQPKVATRLPGKEDLNLSQSSDTLTGDELRQVLGSLSRALVQKSLDPDLVEQIRNTALRTLLEMQSPKLPGNDMTPVTPPQQEPVAQGSNFRQQAHQLLTSIERTQVLNSVNSERGEPLTFQIPLLLDGRTSTAEFYVERRPDEAHKTAPEERHHSLVALLDLDGLGPLRVDLALHRNQLSVKVTVERPETEIFANRLLPELGHALNDHGFALEFLKCERKMDGSAKGAEVRGRTLPAESGLINLEA